MELKQLLDLPSRQGRILRTIWLALPVAVVLDGLIMGVLAVERRHSNATSGSLLESASRIHSWAFWLVFVPLVVWTAVFWWRQRSGF
jgi:hypothetical protein